MKCLRKAWIGCAILSMLFVFCLCMAAEVQDLAFVEGITNGMCLIEIESEEGISSEIKDKMRHPEGQSIDQSIDQSVDMMKGSEILQYISDLVDLGEGFTRNDLNTTEQEISGGEQILIPEEAKMIGCIWNNPLEEAISKGGLPLLSLLGEKAEEGLQNVVGRESIIKSIKPLYIRVLTGIDPGHNDSNPVWSPANGVIAFERSISDKKEIMITRLDGTMIQKIYFQLSDNDNEMNFFFPGIFEEVSYNAGISWSPSGNQFVFMSNGGGGNYDLYICELGKETTKRLTEHKGRDSHAQWSPDGKHLVFVSGRTGKAEVYLMDLENNITMQLTHGEKEFLYPCWSPDGSKIVMLYGSNENHDIYLIDDVTRPAETLKAMTTWTYDDLRPIWSPDGQKIAFYSNHNPENDPKVWAIVVIATDASDPTEGSGLSEKVVATNVVPDIERGPAWMPDSKRIAYIKNDKDAYNPIYIVDIEGKTSSLLKTDTKMNHDVTCGIDGNIAFRAQVEQWDHIYIAKVD